MSCISYRYLFWFTKYSHFTLMMCYFLNVHFQGQRVQEQIDSWEILSLLISSKSPMEFGDLCPCSYSRQIFPILSQITPAHTLLFYFFKFHLMFSSHLWIHIPIGPFPSGTRYSRSPCVPVSFLSVCLFHTPWLDCSNSELKMWKFASCNFLRPVVTFSRLGQYVSQYVAYNTPSLRH